MFFEDDVAKIMTFLLDDMFSKLLRVLFFSHVGMSFHYDSLSMFYSYSKMLRAYREIINCQY